MCPHLFLKKKGLKTMKRRLFLSSALTCIMFFELQSTKSAGQTQTEPIQASPQTAEFITQTVITKARENETIKRAKLTYKRVYTVDNLNDNEQVTDRDKEEVVLIESGGREHLVEKNGKPVREGRSSSQRFDMIKVLEAMVKLDDFIIVKIEMVDNRPYYVINFKPRPGQRANGDIEDIIVRSEGVMYVDIEKFYIKRLSAWMTRPYSRGWGMFNLSRANIEMVLEEFGGIVVMKSLTIVDRYWALWRGDVFERQNYLYKDYQKKE
ncbi:MAG: hypothetical protein A2655_00600 [Candidatus Yanofskybacteria bacterium RIFCSPHIGHO2_01_FULL_43_42]|uniref:Uncharacterized protein n=1 Tax=Candidatus Yanofskybacteria bacterium RIFCSPLOWO2_01_FULL_43_22 TaxID=1802695 RepID=A0A1F8GG43_9BACT|nr:MAG: hypothetical protein A2655_00600 [Candidatus Yanofskybacteria bacterium RIFCSPHIGHO2_01_FULL_43_42]OGN13754.1 MAG: hypothetical protein A3D48_00350 [Candidatus Yanofskybacteria bacterium RIFCSPHIGHO2_02_FULL_43_17]OGN24273.1 MAG: hypothetical protein A3A13_03800 [Candidatus Yanofskybacteria bacterium RIFCSPLOWO2_01_FULL_43_22]